MQYDTMRHTLCERGFKHQKVITSEMPAVVKFMRNVWAEIWKLSEDIRELS